MTREAANCSVAAVQAAITAAQDGDIVTIPDGAPCTWTTGISTTKQIWIRAKNYTVTPRGTSARNVTIINNSNVPLIQMTSGNNFHVAISGIRFNEGTGDVNHIRMSGTGSKIPLVSDCYFEVKNRFGNEPDISAIAWLSLGGIMWNTWIQGVGGGSGGQCCPEGASFLVNSPRSWDTPSTMGQLDGSGTVNVYVEDCTFKDFGQSPDVDSRGRFVMRNSLIDGASGLTHGFTSGGTGGRHAEYYDNTFTSTSGNRNIAKRYFWLRAGTIVMTDNVVNNQDQGYGPPMLLNIGDNTTPTGYPQARQPGWGHDGTNNVLDPIYIWNNTGPGGSTWDVRDDFGWGPYVQLNREIYVDSGAKPGYSKYAYPHPIRNELGATPPPPPSGQPWSGILSPERASDWSKAGVEGGIPSNGWPQCGSTINAGSPSATAAGINSAIQSCSANHVVRLGPGTFNLTSGLIMKSGVVLRGSGSNQTFLIFSGDTPCAGAYSNVCFLGGDSSDWFGSAPMQPGGSQSASWTAGYAKDGSQITLTNIGSTGIHPGTYLNLDQNNDTVTNGGLFMCEESSANPPCSLEGGKGNPGRVVGGIARQQVQMVRVQSCSPSCTNGATLTIDPPLYAPNWNGTKNPGAFWSDQMIEWSGLEDLSLDASNAGSNSNVSFFNAANAWLKGTRQIKNCDCDRNIVSMSQSTHLTIQDNYFYGMSGHSVHYGVESYVLSDALVVNNIFQHTDAPMMLHSNTGSVYAYNYTINNTYDDGRLPQYHWMSSSLGGHSGGVLYNLFEGNVGPGVGFDVFHGNQLLNTAFRNYFLGSDPGRIDNTAAVRIESWCRYFNFVGNVLGTPGYTTTYQGGDTKSIFSLGHGRDNGTVNVPDDPLVASTLLRWGNWDTVNGAARWGAASGCSPANPASCPEIPSQLPLYANLIPTSQSLPDSFYLPSRPSWWPTTTQWPPIGPAVSGGDAALGGHVHKIPAQSCYTTAMGGPADGKGNPLAFDALACYGNTSTPPSVPVITSQPSNASVQVGQSASFSVTASGSQPLTYQWQSRPSASGSFGNIATATSASYTKTNAQLTDSGSQYRVLVSNSVQSNVPSNAATLTVTQAASSGGTAPQAPDVTGINNRTFTTRDDIVIPTVAGATGFNWDISAASGQQPATSGQQPATSGQQPVFVNALATGGWQLATGGWQLATGSPVPTTAPRLSLSSFALTPGAYVLQVQATNNSGASPWASAKIGVVQADFSAIRVYPNPWKKDKHDGHDITFDNLTANSTVKIFTIAGHLVRELPAASGQQVWDLKNDKGDAVASGIYVYVVTDSSGNKKRGKVAVVR